MAGKPILHYSDCRGRMESIRWLLAAAGVELTVDPNSVIEGMRVREIRDFLQEITKEEFDEKFLKTRDDLERLRNDGSLMFQQVPMVEIDGMKLVQTRAILNYIATKYNLNGKDMKERAIIDMYTEGLLDLDEMVLHQPYLPKEEKEGNLAKIKDKSRNRYFPAYEKVLKSHGQDYLVGNKLSRADVYLVKLLYHVEELDPSVLANFPLLKALRTRVSNLPTVKKFLQPGSQRKPLEDEKCVEEVMKAYI